MIAMEMTTKGVLSFECIYISTHCFVVSLIYLINASATIADISLQSAVNFIWLARSLLRVVCIK